MAPCCVYHVAGSIRVHATPSNTNHVRSVPKLVLVVVTPQRRSLWLPRTPVHIVTADERPEQSARHERLQQQANLRLTQIWQALTQL